MAWFCDGRRGVWCIQREHSSHCYKAGYRQCSSNCYWWCSRVSRCAPRLLHFDPQKPERICKDGFANRVRRKINIIFNALHHNPLSFVSWEQTKSLICEKKIGCLKLPLFKNSASCSEQLLNWHWKGRYLVLTYICHTFSIFHATLIRIALIREKARKKLIFFQGQGILYQARELLNSTS